LRIKNDSSRSGEIKAHRMPAQKTKEEKHSKIARTSLLKRADERKKKGMSKD